MSAASPAPSAPASTPSGPAVSVRGLVKSFGKLRAVDGVDLEIARGECFGLLGPNGAGKTTTIEILEGIQRATAGAVEVLGRRWETDGRAIRQRIGIQLQETQFYERFSAEEIVATFRSFHDDPLPADDVLALVGLTDKRAAWYRTLSGGQKQRLALACAVVARPELIFLDEPTTGLDPTARRALWTIVEDLKARGTTLLLTTHYMEEAEVLCDRLAIMDHGKIIARGTPRELIAGLGAGEVIELHLKDEAAGAGVAPASDRIAALTHEAAALPGVASCAAEGTTLRLAVREVHATLPPLLERVRERGIVVERLATRHATLDDVFLRLTGSTIEEAGARPSTAVQQP